MLGLYVAGVTALGANDPQVWLLIVAIVLAPVVVVLGSLGMPAAQQPSNIPGRAVLATLATVIWTLTVPGSGWHEIDKIAENPKTVAVIAAIAGLVFGLIADLIVKDD